jgi:hypothetical protein
MANAILEMVSILKGIAIKGDERISAIIEVFLDVSKATWPFWGLERELLKAAEREKGVFSYYRRNDSSLNLSKGHMTRA